jgi:hypothetical protein
VFVICREVLSARLHSDLPLEFHSLLPLVPAYGRDGIGFELPIHPFASKPTNGRALLGSVFKKCDKDFQTLTDFAMPSGVLEFWVM